MKTSLDFECIVITALSDLRNVQEQYLYSYKLNGLATDSGKNLCGIFIFMYKVLGVHDLHSDKAISLLKNYYLQCSKKVYNTDLDEFVLEAFIWFLSKRIWKVWIITSFYNQEYRKNAAKNSYFYIQKYKNYKNISRFYL